MLIHSSMDLLVGYLNGRHPADAGLGHWSFVLPFSPGICWIPFWREKMSKAQFLFPKRKRGLPFDHGAERRRAQEPRRPSGVEDLNGGNHPPGRMGASRLSRRRYS